MDTMAPESRFQINVLDGRYGLFAIRIFDRAREEELVSWQGNIARHLVESGALPDAAPHRLRAGKSVVSHLIVAAAAFSIMEDRATPKALAGRLRELGVRLTGGELRLARLLFEHPHEHLSRDDITCLFSMQYPATAHRVPTLLERLAAHGVIQKIEVDPDNVFFDIDTHVHAHVFDRRTRSLHDAPSRGVFHSG